MRISCTPGPTLGIGFQSFGSRPRCTRQSWNPAICRAASGKPLIPCLGSPRARSAAFGPWHNIQELGCCVKAPWPAELGMVDIPKRVKRLLRECAAAAHEEELRRALVPIAEAFKRWE